MQRVKKRYQRRIKNDEFQLGDRGPNSDKGGGGSPERETH